MITISLYHLQGTESMKMNAVVKPIKVVWNRNWYEKMKASVKCRNTFLWELFMNYLWAGMMLVSVVYGAIHGTIPEVTQAALDSSKEAVTLCIAMLGILSFWMGLMQIGSASGLIEKMTGRIRPLLCWLFPGIPKDHPALEQIAVNCIAKESIIIGLNKEPSSKRLSLWNH